MLAEGNGDAGDRRELSKRICGMLAVHAMIEEEIFYPRLVPPRSMPPCSTKQRSSTGPPSS
jgi:hypothetical protein